MDIDHILKLARISVSDEEKGEIEKDFFSILKFTEKLSEVDISKVLPINYPTEIKNVFREDINKKFSLKEKEEASKKILQKIPNVKDEYAKVKKIF